MSSVIQVKTVNYPESDGKPMGETDEHRDEMVREIELLRRFYEGQRVYVSGNLLVYYVEGNPKKFVVPDVFVVKGLDPKKRRIYKLWIERKAPDAIIEVTSRKTKKNDTLTKPALYAKLGVKEYFIFDPTQEYLHPLLQGYRLVGDDFAPIPADGQGALVSRELGLRLQAERGQLILCRLDTGERLLTADEARQAAERARQAAERARQAAERARQVAEQASQAAERASQAAEQARQAAEEAWHVSEQARRAAEAEAARLREELRRRIEVLRPE